MQRCLASRPPPVCREDRASALALPFRSRATPADDLAGFTLHCSNQEASHRHDPAWDKVLGTRGEPGETATRWLPDDIQD